VVLALLVKVITVEMVSLLVSDKQLLAQVVAAVVAVLLAQMQQVVLQVQVVLELTHIHLGYPQLV
jgi:hypothetical protein